MSSLFQVTVVALLFALVNGEDFSSYYIFYHYLEAQELWRKFIPGWEQYEGVAAS